MSRIQRFCLAAICVVGWTICLALGACGDSFAPNQGDSFLIDGDTESNRVTVGASWIVAAGFAIDYVYSPEEMLHFDIEAYLQIHADHLTQVSDEESQTSYAEIISHFAAKEGISPRLLIAIMELKSQLVSDSRAPLLSPFGDLSEATGFLEQIRDVTQRLTKARYPIDAFHPRASYQDVLTSVLSADERIRLGGVYRTLFPGTRSKKKRARSARYSALVDPKLQFPYPKGNSKWSFNGTHAPGMASIDFARWESWGDEIVDPTVASGSGKVKVNSSCMITLIHANGWTTSYYHMDKLMYETGDTVQINQPIGYYADNKSQALCDGGFSTGPHVHWTLRKDGKAHSLKDVVLSGWTFHPGQSDYDSNCNRMYAHRDGKKWCPYKPLLNEGVIGVEPPVVAILGPSDQSNIDIDQTGTAQVEATVEASDEDSDVAQVTLYFAGNPYGEPKASPPYTWTLDLDAGVYTLSATATDSDGNVGQAEDITLTIVDSISPSVSIVDSIFPTMVEEGEIAQGTVQIQAADIGQGLSEVTLLVNGEVHGEPKPNAPYEWEVQLPIGSHRISATATDGAGNQSSTPEVPVDISPQVDLILGGCSHPGGLGQTWWPVAVGLLGLLWFRSRLQRSRK